MQNNNRKPTSEEDLMQETKNALAEVLGREPTEQEILRAHAGFKRMAFTMMEHLEHEAKEESKHDSTRRSGN